MGSTKMKSSSIILQEARALEAEITNLKRKLYSMVRQRDEARGKAREYREVAVRYQKELVAYKRGATLIIERRMD